MPSESPALASQLSLHLPLPPSHCNILFIVSWSLTSGLLPQSSLIRLCVPSRTQVSKHASPAQQSAGPPGINAASLKGHVTHRDTVEAHKFNRCRVGINIAFHGRESEKNTHNTKTSQHRQNYRSILKIVAFLGCFNT